jgi:hypothetical protein
VEVEMLELLIQQIRDLQVQLILEEEVGDLLQPHLLIILVMGVQEDRE